MTEKEVEFKDSAPKLSYKQQKLVGRVLRALQAGGCESRIDGLHITVGCAKGEEVHLHITSFTHWL